MSPSTPSKEEGSQDPVPVSAGGTYTIRVSHIVLSHTTNTSLRLHGRQDISVGCKIYAKRWNTDASEPEVRLAEILSIRDKLNNPYLRRHPTSASASSNGTSHPSTPAPETFPS